ncbi:MAG: neutral zinc metallopeptidase [Segniliparus sp.]|uniref:neutral zinc metallopeptidase n=1 Tax=Segniliparus sp. TaxID=2804064 RepID=UPI003F2F7E44
MGIAARAGQRRALTALVLGCAVLGLSGVRAASDPEPALAATGFLHDEGGLDPVDCALPQWSDDPASMRAFFTAERDCLDAAWTPLLARHGVPSASPALAFPDSIPFASPCGDVKEDVIAAIYCEADDTLYVPLTGLQTNIFGNHSGVYAALLAHEYGHHVQMLTGITRQAVELLSSRKAGQPQGLEMSRRIELQAQCFSGMFLGAEAERGAIARTTLAEARVSQQGRGDTGLSDHGTSAHVLSWWERGTNNKVADCNTFSASNEDVA